jgi:long-chain acyl-CoA synthetase
MSGKTGVPDENLFWTHGKGPVEPADLDSWTIPKILQYRAMLEPEAIVYRVRSGSGFTNINWSQLRNEVEAIAAGLAEIGLQRGDRIAILGPSSPFWISVDAAVLAMGGITVGIYPTSTVSEIVDQLDHVDAQAIFILEHPRTEEIIDALRNSAFLKRIICQKPGESSDSRVLPVDELLAAGQRRLTAEPGLFDAMIVSGHIDDPMRLFFTSGSTGKQKAVLHTQRSLVLCADAVVIRNPAMREKPQRVLAFLPLSHISPVLNIFLIPFITSTVACFAQDDRDLIALIAETRPTYLALMPRHYQKLAAKLADQSAAYTGMRARLLRWGLLAGSSAVRRHWDGKPISAGQKIGLWLARKLVFNALLASVGLDAVTRAQTTSAAMPRDVAALWCVYGLDLREGYGSTEAPVIACQLDPFPKPGSVGRKMPKPWYELKFAEDGEILIKSATLFSEYWNDPDETGKTIDDGWYRTGDIGEADERGNIRLIGRKKDIIITAGGKSLNPQDIEAPFRNSPYISEIIVIGEARKFLSALIELSQEAVQIRVHQNEGINFSGYESMARSERVENLIRGEIEKGNENLSRVAQIKRFRILPRPLDVERGEITATRKAKRQVIIENFADLVDDIYGKDEETAISTELKKVKL